MVVTTYQALLQVEPRDLDLLDALAEKLRALGRFPDLIEVLRKRAEAVAEAAQKIEIYDAIARLFIERFANQAEAIKAYEAIRAIDPLQPGALAALEDLYEKRREWEKLIEVKRALAGQAESDARRVALLRDAADAAATKARKPELAVSLWKDVLEADPDDAKALEALEVIFEKEKAYDRLADVLSRRVGLLAAGPERVAGLLKLGLLYTDRLGDTASALTAFESLLEIEPSHARARDAVRKAATELRRWDALERTYARDGAWAELVRQLEALVGSAKDEATRVDLLFRIARISGEQLDAPERAAKAWEKILSIEPDNADAARALVAVYETRGDFAALSRVTEVLLGHATDDADRFDLTVKLASIGDAKGDSDEAFGWYAMALSLRPRATSLYGAAEGAAAGAGSERELADVFGRIADDLDASEEAPWLDLSLRRARLLEGGAQSPEDALVVHHEILARVPGHAETIERHEALLTRLARWDDLLSLLEDKLAAAVDGAQRLALLKRIAALHDEKRGDEAAAIEAHRRVLAESPGDLDALRSLRRLYRQTGDGVELSDVLRQLIAAVAKAEQTELRLELASVLLERVDDPDAALDELATVLAHEPQQPAARARVEALLAHDGQRERAAALLEPLYEADGAWRSLADVLEIRLSSETQTASQVELLRRIGELWLRQVGDPGQARNAFERMLRAEPGSDLALAELERLAETLNAWANHVTTLESIVDDTDVAMTSPARAVALLDRAAELADSYLGAAEEAIRLHRRVLDLAPARASTLLALEALHARLEQWHDLLGVIEERLLGCSDRGERRALLLKAASIREEMLGEPELAIGELNRVLDEQPDDREVLASLDRLFGAIGDASSNVGSASPRAPSGPSCRRGSPR
jgi:tetratricopeptide (TPR) repeat protein